MFSNYGKVIGKIILGFLLFFIITILVGLFLGLFIDNSSYYSSQLGLIFSAVIMLILFERRQNWNLGWSHRKWFSSLGIGIIVGGMMATITSLLLLGLGSVSFELNRWESTIMLGEIFLFFLISVGEETFFRGYLIGVIQHEFNTRSAIVISSILFALIHLVNPGAFDKPLEYILIEMTNILLLGFMFAMTRVVSGNLWMPIGLHFMFNFTQSSVFGFLNGGREVESILQPTYNSQSIWNGATYGLESSLILTIILLDFLLLLHILSKKGPEKVPVTTQ